MSTDNQVFKQRFTIRSSEADPNGKIRLQSLCDLFQESAGNHALQLNFDVSQLITRNLTWFLRRLDIEIDRYPEWREEITITTWPSRGDSLRAYRDFEVTGRDGQTIARALSYWLMINLESRRPVRMPEDVLELGPVNRSHLLQPQKEGPAPPAERGIIKEFITRRSDLDLNGHVNNTRYVEWLMETLPIAASVRSLDIEFKSECRHGETVCVNTMKSDEGVLHSGITLAENDRLLAAARIKVSDRDL